MDSGLNQLLHSTGPHLIHKFRFRVLSLFHSQDACEKESDTGSNIFLLKSSSMCVQWSWSGHVETDPGSPPASIMFARVTSLDQTSYCHFLNPRTPHSTRPVCNPTRMFRSTSVASATDLQMNTHTHTYTFRKMSFVKNTELCFNSSCVIQIMWQFPPQAGLACTLYKNESSYFKKDY